tara:strand:+ start:6859 stop:7551 length:693 start_codon:yes stop_codon:yes gene_type:complete
LTKEELARLKAGLLAEPVQPQGLLNQTPRQQQEAMGDIEFQMENAGRDGPLGYTRDYDPSAAVFMGSTARDPELLYAGKYNNTEVNERHWIPQEGGKLEPYILKPGQVAAVDSYATPETWGHEYSHKESPELSEYAIRLRSAYSATNKREWDSVINKYATWKDITPEQANERFQRSLKQYDVPSWEFNQGARLTNPEPDAWWKKPGPTPEQHYKNERKKQSYFDRELKER